MHDYCLIDPDGDRVVAMFKAPDVFVAEERAALILQEKGVLEALLFASVGGNRVSALVKREKGH